MPEGSDKSGIRLLAAVRVIAFICTKWHKKRPLSQEKSTEDNGLFCALENCSDFKVKS
jgi:hypothetical protein